MKQLIGFLFVIASLILFLCIMPVIASLATDATLRDAFNTLSNNGYSAFADQDGNLDVAGDLEVDGDATVDGDSTTVGDVSGATVTAAGALTGGSIVAPTGVGAVKVVAGANAPQAIKDRADYSCDGIDDDVQLLAAINALTAGRTWKESVKVVGELLIESPVNLDSYTILDLSDARLVAAADTELISADSADHDFEILGGVLDGNKDSGYTSDCIQLDGGVAGTNFHAMIRGVEIVDAGDIGLMGYRANYVWMEKVNAHGSRNRGVFFNGSHDLWVNACLTWGNGTGGTGYGLYFGSNLGSGKQSHDLHVSNHTSYGNSGTGVSVADNGPNLYAYNFHLSGITTYDNSVYGLRIGLAKYGDVVGVIAHDNANNGIEFDSVTDVSLTSFESYGNANGVEFMASDVTLGSSRNSVTQGHIHDNTGNGVVLVNTTYTDVCGNDIYNHSTADYGIQEYGSTDYNTISGNYLSTNTVAIWTVGAHTTVSGNLGYTSENSGTATVANATTTIKVAHGLAAVPARVSITCTGWGNATKAWISSKDSDGDGLKFTISVDADPGASTATFDWRAILSEGQ
ncbi:MAG: hypothetical protein PHV74_06710 [Dehalococcoidia bacterium]|nr:hypothetical protein [Dehalococcoidia bacterium]